MSRLYNGLVRLIRLALPEMETVWEEPFDGEAAVFCPNHAASFGPIAMCAFFSLRDQCHPWLNAGIMERKEIPAYVRQDYWWEPGCFFEPLLNMTLPYLMALLFILLVGKDRRHPAAIGVYFRQQEQHSRPWNQKCVSGCRIPDAQKQKVGKPDGQQGCDQCEPAETFGVTANKGTAGQVSFLQFPLGDQDGRSVGVSHSVTSCMWKAQIRRTSRCGLARWLDKIVA